MPHVNDYLRLIWYESVCILFTVRYPHAWCYAVSISHSDWYVTSSSNSASQKWKRRANTTSAALATQCSASSSPHPSPTSTGPRTPAHWSPAFISSSHFPLTTIAPQSSSSNADSPCEKTPDPFPPTGITADSIGVGSLMNSDTGGCVTCTACGCCERDKWDDGEVEVKAAVAGAATGTRDECDTDAVVEAAKYADCCVDGGGVVGAVFCVVCCGRT